MATIAPILEAIERLEKIGKGLEPLRHRLGRIQQTLQRLESARDWTSDFIAGQHIRRCLKQDASREDYVGFLEILGLPSSGTDADYYFVALLTALFQPALGRVDAGGLLPWIYVVTYNTVQRQLRADEPLFADANYASIDEHEWLKVEGDMGSSDLQLLERVSSRPEREQREILRRVTKTGLALREADRVVPLGLDEHQFWRWQKRSAAGANRFGRLSPNALKTALRGAGLTQADVAARLARIIHEEADYSRKTNAPVWYKGCAHRPFATTEALA